MMEKIGAQLAQGWLLRSGYADGADMAFGRGCDNNAGKFVMYLPWAGFNDAPTDDPRFITAKITPEMVAIARKYHPKWENCSEKAKLMHVRNVCQVLGEDLKTPADMIVCWTEGGRSGGGTGQAIRIAKGFKIPVFDLAIQSDRIALCEITTQKRDIIRHRVIGTNQPY